MNLVVCPRCGAQLDVSAMAPGTTFVCGACQNTLQVPGSAPSRPAPAGRRSAPSAPRPGAPATGRRTPPPAGGSRPGTPPPSPGPARGAGRRVDPRRAAAATPPAPAAPPSRAPAGPGRREHRGPRRERSGPERGGKSNLPLVLGGVGGLVVVVAIVAVIALSGGKSRKAAPENGTQMAGGNPSPAATSEEKESDYRLKLIAAGDDTNLLQGVHDSARKAGFSEIATQAAKKAVQANPQVVWANEALGNKDLRPIYKKLDAKLAEVPDLDTYPNDAYTQLTEMRASKLEWGNQQQFDKAQGYLTAAIAQADHLKNDQTFADMERTKAWVRVHPLFKDYDTEIIGRAPYVIAVEHTGQNSAGIKKEAEEIVNRNGKILNSLYAHFLNYFGDEYHLPKLDTRKLPDERILKVFTFFNRKHFEDYQKAIGHPLPSGVRAYYSPQNQWITLYEGSGFEKQKVAGESDFNTNKIFHEGTHQLIHIYTKILMEDKAGEEVLWSDPRTHCHLHWFQEGIAELMGTTKPRPDGDWDLMQINRNRTVEWYQTQKAKASEWSLEEMLKIRDQGEMRTKARQKGLSQEGRLASLFYSEAWAWCHFLWYGHNGEYRPRFLKYFGMELHGKSGYDYFKQAWGKTDDDWSELDKEWRAYFRTLCEKIGLK